MKMLRFNISWIFVFFLFSNAIISAQNFSWNDEVNFMHRVDLLPSYRTNTVVEQISSYDRTGGNDDGFSGKYSYIGIENGKLVLADLKGPGVIHRIWTATPTNDSITFYFDGETTPRIKIKFNELFSGSVFPFSNPVSGSAIGGNYTYTPIPYSQSCKILFHGPKIEFLQIQYRNLPHTNVETYTGNFTEAERSNYLTARSLWANVFPSLSTFKKGYSSDSQEENKTFTINAGEEVPFFEMNSPGRIVGFEIDAGNGFEGQYKDVILSARWDNETVEAIYAPVADFFGYAYGKASMRSILVGRYSTRNYCYLPMPFDNSANLKFIYKKRENSTQNPITVSVKVTYNSTPRVVTEEGKFYTAWRREINPPIGRYYDFLTHEGKGHYVGTVQIAQGLRPGVTLFFEGDDITHIDGKLRIHGTGSEDYYNGGWYNIAGRWDRAYSLAVHGSLDFNSENYRTGGYRFFLHDKMSFENSIYHAIEHGPEGNEFPVDYASVAYFYSDSPLKKRMAPTEQLRENYVVQQPFLRDDFRPFENTLQPQHGDIAVADIDGDGDLDVIIGGQQRGTPFTFEGGIFINDGAGNFTRKYSDVTPGYMATMNFGDIDGDGDLDLIFNGGVNPGSVWSRGIALNDGAGNFTLGSVTDFPLPPARSISSFFADFNNDGLLDYCHAGNANENSYMALYFQQANGSFNEDRSSFLNYKFADQVVQAVDFNNDGFVDIFVMGRLTQAVNGISAGSFTGLFKNDGTGNFSYLAMPFVKKKTYGSADWADVDGNGWLDFIIHGEGNGTLEPNEWTHRIYKNDGGTFTEAFFYERSRQFSIGGASILQDIDNDGDVDVLFGGYSDRLIPNRRQKTYVYMNNYEENTLSYENFNENYFLSNQYLPGMSEQDFEIADINGDFKPDFIYMGFNEGYSDNPVQANRVIAGWSPSPYDQGLYMHPYVKLTAPQELSSSIIENESGQKILLIWKEPANIAGKKGTTYNLALRNTQSGKWLYNPMSVIGGEKDGWRKINRLGNMYLNKSVELNLPVGQYEWTVQAVDAARFGGSFAAMQALNVTTSVNDVNIVRSLVFAKNHTLSVRSSYDNLQNVKVFSIVGQQIVSERFISNFDVNLGRGIYFVLIESKAGNYQAKIIIQ